MTKSYEEQFEEALACETKEQADKWLEKEIYDYGQKYSIYPQEARKIILVNLGYMAGYYDKPASQKIYALFGAKHPIFGKPDYWDRVTPEEAFEMGQTLAREVTLGQGSGLSLKSIIKTFTDKLTELQEIQNLPKIRSIIKLSREDKDNEL